MQRAIQDVPNSPRELTIIQAARGLAALLVVFFHATVLVQLPKYWNVSVLGGTFLFGDAGVRFFFVLSGFIILWVHSVDIGRPARLQRYMRRRFVRVYPPYWIALALAILGNIAIGNPLDAPLLLESLLLVGPTGQSLLAVGWTLFYEIFFYALFALLIANRQAGIAAIALWVVLCLADAPLGYPTAPLNLLFVLGLGCAFVLRRHRIPAPTAVLIVGIMLFLVGGAVRVLHDAPDIAEIFYGLGAAMIILGGVECERSRSLRAGWALRSLGDSSYALYLTHFLVISAAAKLLVGRTDPLMGFTLLVVVAVVFGIVFHLVVEKPLLNWLRPQVARPSSAPVTAGDQAPRLE